MRKFFLSLAAAAAVIGSGCLANPAVAMPLGSADAVKAAIDDTTLLDRVHCRPGRPHHRTRRGLWDGCVVAVAPAPLIVVPAPIIVAPRRRRPRPVVVISDIRVKQDIQIVQHVSDGIDLYRFRYTGDDKVYVGVVAQDIQAVRPDAVVQGSDGLLRVNYSRLGLRMQTWEQWKASQH